MKSSQSMWCLCSSRFDLRTTQRKSSERTTVMDSFFFKVWGVCRGGVEAEKSALYVSKSKDLPTYKLWQVGKYRYIQYQRSLRCYSTMFSSEGAGGVAHNMLVELPLCERRVYLFLWLWLIQMIAFRGELWSELRAMPIFHLFKFLLHCDWKGNWLLSQLLTMLKGN